MAKFVLIVLASIIAVQAMPSTYDELVEAARKRNWDEIQELLNINFPANLEWKPSFNNVRNLKALEGGHVYGEAEYTFQSSSNINGKTAEQSGGHKVINNDGTVKEFDFKPKL